MWAEGRFPPDCATCLRAVVTIGAPTEETGEPSTEVAVEHTELAPEFKFEFVSDPEL